jgi:hypothetical protein
VLGLIREYRVREFPRDVFMVDTDWRVSASSGYDENLRRFPPDQGGTAPWGRAGQWSVEL